MGLGLNDARRMLIGGFIAWAMVAAHLPLAAQSSATDVDLSGIGEVQVEADPVLLAPFADLTIHGIEPDVLLYFDIDGRPTDCRPNSDRPAAFVELLCRELLAKGHLELPAGYDLAGQRGFLPVHAGGSAAAVEAVEPIAFAAGEGGQELAVFTAAAPNVAKGPCMVMELGGGPALAEKGKQAICAAFQRGGDRERGWRSKSFAIAFKVAEEEHLIAAVVEMGNNDRSTYGPSPTVIDDAAPRLADGVAWNCDRAGAGLREQQKSQEPETHHTHTPPFPFSRGNTQEAPTKLAEIVTPSTPSASSIEELRPSGLPDQMARGMGRINA